MLSMFSLTGESFHIAINRLWFESLDQLGIMRAWVESDWESTLNYKVVV